MRVHVHSSFDTALPPERVVATLTDFSAARPDIWPNLDRGKYQVHEVGDTWAEVTEGSRSPNIWARERYDWPQPGKVSWRALESNFCAPGSGVDVVVSPGRDRGSHVEIDWQRTPTSPTGYLIAAMMALLGKRMLAQSTAEVFDRVAQQPS
jgi:hypothetical protein